MCIVNNTRMCLKQGGREREGERKREKGTEERIVLMYNDAIDGCIASDTPRPSGMQPPWKFMYC